MVPGSATRVDIGGFEARMANLAEPPGVEGVLQCSTRPHVYLAWGRCAAGEAFGRRFHDPTHALGISGVQGFAHIFPAQTGRLSYRADANARLTVCKAPRSCASSPGGGEASEDAPNSSSVSRCSAGSMGKGGLHVKAGSG